MANAVPSDKVADLQLNAKTMDEVVSSDNPTTTARPTPTDPTGKVIKTLTGINADLELALQRIGVQYSDPIKDWAPSLLVDAFEAHRYPATTGDIYIPTAPLPFTTGATFDSDNWTLLQGVNSAYLDSRLSVYTEDGILPWDAGVTYPVDGLAKGSDGTVYIAISEQSGNNPISDTGGNWVASSLNNKSEIFVKPVAGETDFMPRLEALSQMYDEITCVGTFPILTSMSTSLLNTTIKGVRGMTIFDLSGATGEIFTMADESKFESISFLGDLLSEPDVEDGITYAADVDEIISRKGEGVLTAIRQTKQSCHISDCEFTLFSGFSVVTNKNNVSSNSKAVDTNIYNSRFAFNFGAIDILEESEYMKFSNNSICWNVYGIYKRGGNNTFTGNNIDHNRVNFVSRDGLNNSHGGITGGTMNHGKLCALLADKITVGEAITGVNFFDSGELGIYIRESVGVNIIGNLLGRTNIYCEGQGTVSGNYGVNRIANNLFNLHGVTYQIYRNWNSSTSESDPSTPDNCVFRDNYHMEGQASRDGSSWDEYILNDDIAPDSDGFTQQQTIDPASGGDDNSRIVSGRPLDGTQYLGNGNQTGAVRIKCPVAGFNNSNVRMCISIRTSNRLGCKVDFNGFISNSGDWVNVVPYDVKGTNYAVRLGRGSDGKPLIYIGELTTTWTSAVVEIEFFSMHAGVYSESKFWKNNWEITQENTSFENVSNTFWGDVLGFTGDLDDIDYDSDFYVSASATNTPNGVNGWCKTKTRSSGSNIRMQEYFESVTNKLYVRTTQTGSAGWTSWVEK